MRMSGSLLLAGELVPRTAVGPAGDEGLLQVPVAVDAERVPPSVAAGSVVDLYVLPSGGDRCAARCAPVLTSVTVISASSLDEGFGASGQRQLVLGVAELTPHFQCVRGRAGNMDTLTVRIERREHVGVEAGEAAGRHVAELVKRVIGVSVGVEVVEPFGIERSVGKMRRIVDQRPKD